MRGIAEWFIYGAPEGVLSARGCRRLKPGLNASWELAYRAAQNVLLVPAGEVDWDWWIGKFKEYGPLIAGALFGAGGREPSPGASSSCPPPLPRATP